MTDITEISPYSLCGILNLKPEDARTIVTGSPLHIVITQHLIELSACVAALGDLLDSTDGQQLNTRTRADTSRLLTFLGDIICYLAGLLRVGRLAKS